MGFKLFLSGIVFLFLSTVIQDQALAGKPTDSIRKTTDKIIGIVSDPDLKETDKRKEKDLLIRKAVDEIFDWREMSRRTLARHWRKRTEQEIKEFIDLFGKLLERTYLDKVEGYSGEEVLYKGEAVDGDYGVVKIMIITKKETEISVFYRMKKKGDDWFVYDISVGGVSLINNYRTQFNSIIVRSSFKKLMKKLKAKVEE